MGEGKSESSKSFERNWLPVVVIIAAAVTCVNLFMIVTQSNGERHELAQQAWEQAVKSQLADGDPTNMPCSPPMDLRTSDLCAQWKAADAAVANVAWTQLSSFISVVTLFALIFGFLQNDKTQKREYRCYVKAKIEKFDFGDVTKIHNVIRNRIVIENYGRTPALFVNGVYYFTFHEIRNNGNIYFEKQFTTKVAELPPHEPMPISPFERIHLFANELEMLRSKHMHIQVGYVGTYVDVFGQTHKLNIAKLYASNPSPRIPNQGSTVEEMAPEYRIALSVSPVTN